MRTRGGRKSILFQGSLFFAASFCLCVLCATLTIAISLIVAAIAFGFGFYSFRKRIVTPMRKLARITDRLGEIFPDAVRSQDTELDGLSAILDQVVAQCKEMSDRERAADTINQQCKFAELQSQINPHFLYNTLETIRGQSLIDGNAKIAEMTEALAKYFRYNISHDNDIVPLADELGNITNYVKIQQYRFEDRFDFRIIYHGDRDDFIHCRIPKMTLQPVVENAIFHGLESKAEFGHLLINLERTSERLIVIVQDDGVGIPQETLGEINARLRTGTAERGNIEKQGGNGIAMININLRLRLLFGQNYGVSVTSTIGIGTEVEIVLPATVGDKE